MWKKLAVLWTLLRSDAVQLWRALRHPLQPRWLKPATALPGLWLTGQDVATCGVAGALIGGVLCASGILKRNLLTGLRVR